MVKPSGSSLEQELDIELTDTDEHARLMAELIVLALRCDLTRSITFMLGNSASSRSYPQLGISATHHDLSHHAGNLAKIEDLLKVEAWEMEQLAYLLQRLRETPEGEASLLDSCIVLMSSELSDGSNHSHEQLPVLIAGSGGGVIGTGRHVIHEPGTRYGDLLLGILHALGVPAERVGQGGVEPLASLFE
ncbi:MAG: DUF1552 domain-containing protein [Deltaproteobacteria bacterium]|nr:DUF1552 domain-containing protein [Deltaproteobacteria bacterium]